MRVILTVILSSVVLSSYSQTIRERERDLDAYMYGTTWKTKTEKAWELLSIDKFNETAIRYILRVYNADYKRDSITIFFESLINNNKNNIIPYLLRIKFSEFERLHDEQRIEYLTRAYQLDSSCVQVDSLLGRLCYNQFNERYLKHENKNDKIKYYARTSMICLDRLCSLDKRFQRTLKYPLIQLSSYLEDSVRNKKYKGYKHEFYFPLSAFGKLPNNWETNYGFNLMDESVFYDFEWFSKDLEAMNEPVLFNSTARIFRFTLLPSTGNFYVIGLKNENGKVTIYWKVFENTPDNRPGKKIIDKTKQLELNEWTKLSEAINQKKFWNKPSFSYSGGVDGSTWIFEGKELTKYNVMASWGGYGQYEFCLTLKKLTDLENNEEK